MRIRRQRQASPSSARRGMGGIARARLPSPRAGQRRSHRQVAGVGRADCHPPCAGQRLFTHMQTLSLRYRHPRALGHADDRCAQVAVPRRSIGAQHRQTHRSHACHRPCARSTVVSNAPGNVRRIAIPARRGHGAGGEKPRAAIKLAVPVRRAWSQNARSRLPPRADANAPIFAFSLIILPEPERSPCAGAPAPGPNRRTRSCRILQAAFRRL